MPAQTLEATTDDRREPRRSAQPVTASRLSDFGQLGYGINIVNIQPTVPLVDFTYAKGQTFHFHEDILIPDQFVLDPTPSGQMHQGAFSGVMTTARDYQRTLSARFLGGVPVDGIQFKGESQAANERFTRESETTVRMLAEKLASFEFLRILKIDLASSLTDEVRQAVADAGTDEAAIEHFFGLYGTHVVARAAIGGQMHLESRLQITAKTSKEITQNDIDISREAEAEAAAYIKGTINFHDRFEKNSKIFVESSSTDYQLLGGEVTATDVDAWRDSLKNSRIPTVGGGSTVRRVSRHGTVGFLAADNSQYLGLVSPKLVPIYEALGLTSAQEAVWKTVLDSYFGDVSPFDDTPKRFTVEHLGSALRDQPDKRVAVFEMGGWHETWEDDVALEALPMAKARVAVKTNSPFDEWTEKEIFAGLPTHVREKTGYWGDRYTIKVITITGDPDAVVYARTRKVAW